METTQGTLVRMGNNNSVNSSEQMFSISVLILGNVSPLEKRTEERKQEWKKERRKAVGRNGKRMNVCMFNNTPA